MTFRSLIEASEKDWAGIEKAEAEKLTLSNAGEGLLRLLYLQRNDPLMGWPINIYEHSLQCATRAIQAGESDELVFCALFHDAAELVAPHNHDAAIAELLSPYIDHDHRWMVEHHAEFQNQFAHQHPFRDRNAYRRHIGHSAFDLTMRFCEFYDQNSFDPNFTSLPLKDFEDLVDKVCRRNLPKLGGS